jgi:hypothetical protein
LSILRPRIRQQTTRFSPRLECGVCASFGGVFRFSGSRLEGKTFFPNELVGARAKVKVSFEVSIVSLDSASEALERVSLSFYAARSAWVVQLREFES